MLDSALEHYRRQQRISAAGLVAARRARNKGPLEVARVVTAFQVVAARDAAASVPQMLDEQGVVDDPVGNVAVAALAGVASDGRSLDSLFDQAKTDYQFGLMVATQLQDAARGAAGVAIASRNRVGYVRMLNPPSCSRCAVLAGKWFGWNAGFQRHPRCDCRHIPSLEVDKYDHLFSGDKYFHSLPSAEELAAKHPDLTVKMRQQAGLYSQEDIFTKAGAKAIRDGADVTQVVNARRGMAPAQLFGRDVLITREGITRRGSMAARRLAPGTATTSPTRAARLREELQRAHRQARPPDARNDLPRSRGPRRRAAAAEALRLHHLISPAPHGAGPIPHGSNDE
jgi:hypothetical protein